MRYWERKAEQVREGSSEPKKESKDKSSKSSSDRQQTNNTDKSKGKGKKKATTNEPTRTDISDKLGKDSKSLLKEHQRRIDNNLCLLCGADSHKVAECPKSTRAQETTTMTTPKASSASDTEAETSAKVTETKK